jgi:hypothetical protein
MAQKEAAVKDFISDEEMQQLERSGASKDFITDAEMAALDGNRPGTSSAQPKPLTALEKVEQWLPSPRTTLRTGGMIIGSTIGGAGGTVLGTPIGGIAGAATGGAAGASIGESLYELGQHAGLFNDSPAPQTPSEAASRQTGALVEGGVQGGVGAGTAALAQAHAEHPLIPALRAKAQELIGRYGPSNLFRSAPNLMMRGLTPTDPDILNHLETALTEMKAAPFPVRNTATALQALESRTTENNRLIDVITAPQSKIKVPGSAAAMAKVQAEAIPEDIRLNDPDKYEQLLKKAQTRTSDYTIGELNALRKELNATQSPYYGKDLAGQLTMDAGTRAIDVARGRAARSLFYEGLDNYGLGGGDSAREINSRIGSIIHMQDAIRPRVNKAYIQSGRTVVENAERTIGNILSPVRALRNAGQSPGVDEDIATAMQRWNRLPKPVQIRLEARPGTVRGDQMDLLPSDTPARPLLRAPNATLGGNFPWVRSYEPPPQTVNGQQLELCPFPGPLGQQRFDASPLPPNAAPMSPADYVRELQRQRMWMSGAQKPTLGQQTFPEMQHPELLPPPTAASPRPTPEELYLRAKQLRDAGK